MSISDKLNKLIEHATDSQIGLKEELNSLKKQYEVCDEKGLKLLLSQFPILVSFLQDAKANIYKYFPNTNIKLKVAQDFDCYDPFGSLLVIIETNKTGQEAYKQISRMQKEWFIQQDKTIISKVTIDCEFKG